jgi:hypothetical protein
MDITQERECARCAHRECRCLPAVDALYERNRIWLAGCANCGSSTFKWESTPYPSPTPEVVAEWARNAAATVGGAQEQDVSLALAWPLELRLALLECQEIVRSQQWQLVGALIYEVRILIEEQEQRSAGETPPAERDQKISLILAVLTKNLSLVLEGHEQVGYGEGFENEVLPRLAGRTSAAEKRTP